MKVKIGQVWLWKPTKDLYLIISREENDINIDGLCLRDKRIEHGLTIYNFYSDQKLNNNWKYLSDNKNIARILYGETS
jgi:hypothetical protein